MKQDDYYNHLKDNEIKERQKFELEKEKKEARLDMLDNLHQELTVNEELEKVKPIKKA